MVECDLAKVEVAGSNPVSRSIIEARRILRARPSLHGAPTPHSAPDAVTVGEYSARVLRFAGPDRFERVLLARFELIFNDMTADRVVDRFALRRCCRCSIG